jgi:hypothetical protein
MYVTIHNWFKILANAYMVTSFCVAPKGDIHDLDIFVIMIKF